MSIDASIVEEFTEYFLGGDLESATARTVEMLDGGMPTLDFFEDVFTPAMGIVGDKFGALEIFLPELVEAGETAQALSNDIIQPRIMEERGEDVPSQGKIVMASVKGDLHDIGKNMVALMLEVNGYEVVDMGVNVDTRAIIDRALEVDAQLVGLSSLMTTSMPYMKEVAETVQGLGYSESLDVIVGGAPITQEYADAIGADAFGEDAMDGVVKCNDLMEKRRS